MTQGQDQREITSHHDGFGLNDNIKITADAKSGPGGASHTYVATVDGEEVARIHFQEGPLKAEGSKAGISERALLMIILDRLQCFNEGQFRTRENAVAATNIEQGAMWLHARAMERARRQVLGSYEK